MEEILGGISNKANKICRNLTRWHLFSGLQFAHGIPRAGRSRPRNGIFGKFRQWVRSRMPALPCSEDTVRKKKKHRLPSDRMPSRQNPIMVFSLVHVDRRGGYIHTRSGRRLGSINIS